MFKPTLRKGLPRCKSSMKKSERIMKYHQFCMKDDIQRLHQQHQEQLQQMKNQIDNYRRQMEDLKSELLGKENKFEQTEKDL